MGRCFLVLLLCVGIFGTGSSQSRVFGKIVDTTGKPIVNANVLLVNSQDSVLVKGMLTREGGTFSFDNIHSGGYRVTATYTGVQPVYSQPFEVTDKAGTVDLGAIQLDRTDVVLSAVTVTAKKPLYEQKIDRLVINVAAAITYAGISALDVLERSPGVLVNRVNNSLSVNGKDGVIIMINGKRNYMSIGDVMQMLASLPSGSVERIEIITTPPANFDAEGNAGIINIVLKSNDQYGTNGSYTLTAGYMKGLQTGASMNINHRKGKVNLFGNYSFWSNRSQQLWTNYHAVTNGALFMENYSEDDRHFFTWNHNVQAGVDYEIDKKTIVGTLLSGNYRHWTMTSYNNAWVTTNNKLDTSVSTINDELHTTLYLGANLNCQHTFKPDEKIVVNTDYLYYADKNPNTYSNSYYDETGNFLYDEHVQSNKETPLKFLILAADYSKKLSKKVDMEAGLKSTESLMTNDVNVSTLSQNYWITDTVLSGSHSQRETINAAYTSFSVKFSEKTSMKAGLRYEYTHTILGTIAEPDMVERPYGKLFPSFFFQQSINDNNSLNFSYSRRIYRPSFNDLAPWVIFLDPKTFQSGNPNLKPSITDAVNLSYTYRNKIVSFSYSYTAPTITGQPIVDVASNKLITTSQNSKNSQWLAANFSLPFTVAKWWNMQNNITFSYLKWNTFYLAPVQTESKNYYFNIVQNFLLPKDCLISLSGYYNSKSIWGLNTFKPWGSLSAAVQKKFARKRSSLTFNAYNVLSSQWSVSLADIPEQNLLMSTRYFSGYRSFSLSYTKNFGDDKVKQKRDRTTGAEDERDRAY